MRRLWLAASSEGPVNTEVVQKTGFEEVGPDWHWEVGLWDVDPVIEVSVTGLLPALLRVALHRLSGSCDSRSDAFSFASSGQGSLARTEPAVQGILETLTAPDQIFKVNGRYVI